METKSVGPLSKEYFLKVFVTCANAVQILKKLIF
jgi:hypothetical protein